MKIHNNDTEIIRLILQGDRNAFGQLVAKYQTMVFRTCMGFLHNKDDADDLTQDIFIRAYRSLSDFKGKAAFPTWLYRIAVNASLNHVRKASGNPVLKRLDLMFGTDKEKEFAIPISEADNPETILIREEHREWVQEALDNLPENQRTAIILSKYDDLSQKEIAAIMKKTEGAVEALIQRARINLRKNLLNLRKK